MGDWSRLLNTTIPMYLREVEVNILKNRKLLALMQQKGRIRMNCSGTLVDWKVKFKRAPLTSFADGDIVSFARRDRYKTAQLPWRAYNLTDMISDMEILQNKNEEAIVKDYQEMVTNLVEDIDDEFGSELYIDGNAAGNSRKIHGLESFFATNGAASPGYMLPGDSYANLNTAPGSYGGQWNGVWPVGSGDAHYEFFSPVIIDYTCSNAAAWSSATKTWQNTCNEALRAGIMTSQKTKSKTGMLDLILLENELFRQFKNAQDSRQQLQIHRNEAVGLVALGFTDVVNWDGVDITTEYGMPSGIGYGFNTSQMELMSLQSQLFMSKGPYYDEDTQANKFAINYYGNARFNPKFFLKLGAFGTS